MKAKHFFMMLIAAACCMNLFTACGSDSDDSTPNPAEDKTRAKVAMVFSYYVTEDMLKYCDVTITSKKGDEVIGEVKLTDQSVVQVTDHPELYGHTITLVANSLPATFSFSRTVKMKDNADLTGVESVRYSKSHSYKFGYYNAADKLINDADAIPFSSLGTSPASADKFVEFVNAKKLDVTYVYTFDKNKSMEYDIIKENE